MKLLAIFFIPPLLLKLLIYGALIMTGLGALILLALLVRDWHKNQLW